MLKHLHIQNYALIDNLDIEFQQGLNIITGETGAGKSILIGALGLVLGQRADASILKSNLKSCVVEALFQIGNYGLKPFFDDNDLDYNENTTIRRQINEAGKSRAFVNEVPVNLSVLKDLVEQIIDIHSQHQSLLLAESSFQLIVLDSYAGLTNAVNDYHDIYIRYKKTLAELLEIEEKSAKAKADLDYLQFQLSQLDEAKLVAGEQKELELQQQQLAHAEEIKLALQNTINLLNSESSSLIVLSKEANIMLSRISGFYSPASKLAERVDACRIELKDIASEVENLFDKLEVDPERLSYVDSRLDLIFSLQQKHRVGSVEELISLREKLKFEVEAIAQFDSVIGEKNKYLKELTLALTEKSNSIGKTRRSKCAGLEKEINEKLKDLGMPFASFKVEFEKANDFLPTGTDRVSFIFSANKQMPMQEISKVASGGELSRLMLSLKSLLVKTKELPTIIFDEIDSGVSGEVADKMGNIINSMASDMQVINITHLPQIASKGKHHFLVYKDNESETSKTQIRLLSKDERVVEIAKMLSGESLSDAAMDNARHLLYGN